MPFDSASQPLRITELTLADVLAAVRTAELPNRQRQELASALRSVGRALDRPLERIQADPRHLAPRLKAVAPGSDRHVAAQLEQYPPPDA